MFIKIGVIVECLEVVVVGLQIRQLVLLDQVNLLLIEPGRENREKVIH